MNNTKRKILTGVIAAVVCFTMILTSFGALIGAALGILSNEDLINAINDGSLYLGDGVNLSNITLGGGGITDVAKDGYQADPEAADREIAAKRADYTKYNAPYYTNATVTELSNALTSSNDYGTPQTSTDTTTIDNQSFTDIKYGAQSGQVANVTISANTMLFLANGARVAATEGNAFYTTTVNAGYHLVIAMATAEQIYNADTTITNNDFRLNGAKYGAHFADDIFTKGTVRNADDTYTTHTIGSTDSVYGICIKMTNFVISKNASLTLLGRDFNGNGYIDDMPVGIDMDGDGTYEWFYEKIVVSGSSTYRQFTINEELFKANTSMIENYKGQAMPLISIYGGSTAANAQKIIISGADLRNHFNNKKNKLNDNSERDWLDDDANLGGGAIYLAAGSTNNKYITTDTCGYFSDVIITSSTFSYCGAARGGAIMVGKNFNATGCLDFSYSNFSYCYTVYDCYGRHSNALFNRITQSGDGGAICFYQDDTFTDPWSLWHNNPSLIVINEVDLTGADFKYCYAMRDGGAIFFGGYNYGEDVRTRIHATSGNSNDSFRYYDSNANTVYTANDELGTRIKKLTIKDASFYGCGAGWMIDNAPVDASGNPLTGSSFIYTTTPGNLSDTIFAALEEELRLIDVAGGYFTTKNSALFSVVSVTSDVTAQAGLRWMQSYDGGVGSPDNKDDRDTMIATDYKLYNSTANHPNSVRRQWNGWLNILQGYVKADYRRGGAMALNCRIAEMVVSDTTFKYCATDSEGSAVYMDDFFVSPHVEFNNCLFENNLGTMSGTGTGTGTLRSTGLVAADVHINNCSFLYNCNMNSGAVCMNLNNTYTGAEVGGVSYKVSYAEAGAQPDGWGYAGTEINDCVFFGNFAQAEGAAVKSSGVTDISSSTFAYNVTNNGEGGAIHFSSYDRIGVDVGSKTAHMRLDPKVGDGHTIICNNRVGGTAANDGGGAIAIVASNSRSIGNASGSTPSVTVNGKSIFSRDFTFKFELGGLLIFDNYSAVSGGGILFRIDSTDPTTLDAKYKTFAWLYDKIITLNEGYIFNNEAKNSGGGVAIFDEYSQLKAVAQSSIEGANIYNNSADSTGGGLYLNIRGGKVDVVNGNVLGNTALQGGGIMITNTANVNITGGQIGSESYMSPAISIGNSQSTFGATSSKVSGANEATNGNGGGIYIVNELTAGGSDYDNSTTVAMTGGLVECNTATGDGGGIYMARPSANDTYGKITFNMSGSGTSYGFVGNKAANGGGIYVSSGDVTSDDHRYTVALGGGTISENTATANGGGVYVNDGADFTMGGGNIASNTATTGNGGGVYIAGAGVTSTTTTKYPADAIKTDGTLDQSKLTLNVGFIVHSTNTAWVQSTDATNIINDFKTYLESELKLDVSKIKIQSFPVTYTNVADTVAAILGKSSDIHVIVGGGTNIYDNLPADQSYDVWATNEQMKTTTYSVHHLIKTTYADARTVAPLTKNVTASDADYSPYLAAINDLTELFYRFMLRDGTTYAINSLDDATSAGLIKERTVTTTAVGSSATISAGNIAGNTATEGFGGGVCCDDGSTVKLNATGTTTYPVIDGNTAKNGGGVAVIEGSDLTMQGGYVINNKAVGDSSGTRENNRKSNYMFNKENGGVGGGIYVANTYAGSTVPTGDNMATFTINLKNDNNADVQTGIYLNRADFAADDVFANAYGTQLTVPAFSQMTIKDNAGKPTGWFEDYANAEPRYYLGLRGNTAVTSVALSTTDTVERYKTASAGGRGIYEAWINAEDNGDNPDPQYYINRANTFVCVTLGAYVVYDGNLTITKDVDGTVDTEQVFVFRVRRTFDQYGNATSAGDVDLYVTINGEGSVTVSSLPLGIYEVTELTEWSWRYSVTGTTVTPTRGEAIDTSATANDAIVEVELYAFNKDDGTCNDPKITFVNKLAINSWLDGNSPKVVNTAGETAITDKEIAYANFKREETLI